MKLVNYSNGRGRRLGAIVGGDVIDLQEVGTYGAAAGNLFSSIQTLLEGGANAFDMARVTVENATSAARDGLPYAHPLAEVVLHAPVPQPGKIVCVGLNYMDHCRETGTPVPERPIIFSKFPSSVIGPEEAINWEPVNSSQVDYEAELAVVIGRRAQRIAARDAYAHIAGYTLLNDVSARDAQFQDGQWVRGKSFDTFCPMGPYLLTTEDVADPHQLGLQCRVNGKLVQNSNTSLMIFKIPEIIAYVSATCTLLPGDVIATGTPHGVGFTRNPPVFLQPGDIVEVSADGLGVLKNHVGPEEGDVAAA